MKIQRPTKPWLFIACVAALLIGLVGPRMILWADQPVKDDPQVRALQVEYRDALRKAVTAMRAIRVAGSSIDGRLGVLSSEFYDCEIFLIDAELDLARDQAERIKVLEEGVELARQREQEIASLSRDGVEGGESFVLSMTTAARIRAEIRLARERLQVQ